MRQTRPAYPSRHTERAPTTMLNIPQWQEIDLKVLGELHLDDRNVRLENTDNKVEADLLQDLFTNENVMELVSGIAAIGFLTHEYPIVVKRRSRYVVVEGNRRIAALKALQNPMLVPAFQSRIKEVVGTIPKATLKSLAHVRVKVAPNQEQANQLIAALHTGTQRRAWTPARQAAFFHAQIEAGRTYDELVTRYPTVEVAKFVFRSHVLRLVQNTALDEAELNDYVASPAWRRSSSTIERIYEKREFLDITGIRMESGVFTHSLAPDQVKALVTVIVRGIKDGNLNTRTINKVDSVRWRQLMNDLRQAIGVPDTSPGGGTPGGSGGSGGSSTTSGSGTGSGGGGAAGATSGGGGSSAGRGTGGGSKKAPQKQRNFIQVNLTVPSSYSVALDKHYQELTVHDIQKMPNTAYLALRAILEKTIKQFAEAKGVDIATAVNAKGYVQLQHSLEWFEQYATANGLKALVQPIRKVRSGKTLNYGSNYSSTKDAMDAANHNHKFLVSPTEVLDLWDAIEPLLRELLTP